MLPTLTIRSDRSPVFHLYQPPPPRLGMTDDYIGLELMVGGAVDEGDVVLFFIGEHTLFGCEVLDGPVWHFDGVGDTGILATGLYEITVGLFR